VVHGDAAAGEPLVLRQSVFHSGTPLACVVRNVFKVTARTVPMRPDWMIWWANFTTGGACSCAPEDHPAVGPAASTSVRAPPRWW